MQNILQNKYFRIGAFALGTLIALLAAAIAISYFFGQSSQYSSYNNQGMFMGEMATSDAYDSGGMGDMMFEKRSVSSYTAPNYAPTDYSANLESNETTNYDVNGQIKELDDFCQKLSELKAREQVHFKQLNSSLNNCQANFYVENEQADEVLDSLKYFKGINYTKNTQSVTRHKQQIESRTAVVEAQLKSVENTLMNAEIQFDELAEIARANNDAATLSESIRLKLENIDMLTMRRINLIAQLDQAYQQAADLEERMGVIEFSVYVTRTSPIITGEYERKWEQAYRELKDTVVETLIGLTFFFGIFLLWAIRLTLYAAVVLLIVRGLWKLALIIWKKL